MTEQEFTRAVERYGDMLYRIAFSYCKNRADADDLVQNAFIKYLRGKKPFASEEHLRNWLIRVTVNECKQHFRLFRRRPENLADYENTLVFESDDYGDLFEAIMALNKKYREVIILYYYEGYSIAETAALLGLPSATVGTRLRRAREALNKQLTEVTAE